MEVPRLGKTLRKFIDEQAEKYCMPIQHGNSVRIKNFVVRKNPWVPLYDLKCPISRSKQHLPKTAALALAKLLLDNNDPKTALNILQVDDAIQSKYNECISHKNTHC